MADIFTIIGVIIIVFGALLFASWFIGYIIDSDDWYLPAWLWSVFISTGIISGCIVYHVLKIDS